ncbi:Rieske (2Fe-2S) protein [Roseibacterium sp. SDUM158016]|uniref:Rieske (2Fe-2S) protein n=1 Tax=Roseicyclus sediminis TaxID=2980997 RepID=UPI0021CE40FC|nr:Rieske (2Fe-2S) protein [Roseibacterium sp. SDUM158016]MCU4652092.1 Rieske (2Fe-2S) protein [Roseibacterium sp. SDUM158016]
MLPRGIGGSDDFVDVCTTLQVPASGAHFVSARGRDVMLTRGKDQQIIAFAGNCTHAFAPLKDGRIENGEVVCALHGARFDLATGRARSGGCPNLPRLAVRIEGRRVLVRPTPGPAR